MVALSGARASASIRTSEEPVRVSLGLVLAWWLLRRVTRLVVLIVTTPAAVAGIGAAVGLVWLGRHVNWWLDLGLALMLAGGLILLRVERPAVYQRWVAWPARGWWRAWTVYRSRWTRALAAAKLTTRWHRIDYAPTIRRVRSTSSVDRVRLRMLPGHTLDLYTAAAPGLAQSFGAQLCRVHTVPGRVHELELWLLVADPLTTVVEPLPPAVDPLTEGLPVAQVEDGTVWPLQLVGSHLLIVGATGAGKGSVIWSIITQLAPPVRAGVVRLWVIDPKGGMELAAGRALFDRFCHGDSAPGQNYEAGFADLLDDAVTVMRRRQDRLRGVTRLHAPSVDEPLIVIVIDELAALTGWITDRVVKKRIETALGLLLSQGRAVGVVVVGAVQDPRKDVLPMRDLFPTRICLRVAEAEHVTLTLGPGARDRGALADQISDRLPGVGYVTVDGIAEPVRVRFAHIADKAIDELLAPDRPTLRLVDDEPDTLAA